MFFTFSNYNKYDHTFTKMTRFLENVGDNLQEIDVLRFMLFSVCIMISFVTFAKQLRIRGLFGTSNKLISIGTLLLATSLLVEAILSIINYQDVVWLPILQISILILTFIGFGFIFIGLWKISIFFDELKMATKKSIGPSKTD
ncbi:hypothetical protein CEE45_16175 [Candidatus Heimdallarchaeota archaeon B3_Heim]|nr:MAG: hypothetical protein CEE45_16175 [Candidatus Heimdallarchaeota archaeon B3_Heim]